MTIFLLCLLKIPSIGELASLPINREYAEDKSVCKLIETFIEKMTNIRGHI